MHVTWIKDKTNKLIDAPNGLPLMLNYLILFDTAWYSSRDLWNQSFIKGKGDKFNPRIVNQYYIITCISSTLVTLLPN